MCWYNSRDSLLCLQPQALRGPTDAPRYPLESKGTVCRGWQVPSAQAVALLKVGQRSGDAFLGRCVLSLRQWLNVLLVGPLMGLVKAQPCRELIWSPNPPDLALVG